MSKEQKLYDLSLLKEIEKNDEKFIRDLIDIFIKHAPKNAEDLVKACSNREWNRAYFIAHQMKASIDLLEIKSIQNDILAVEQNAKEKTHLDNLSAKANYINEIIKQCTEEMKKDFN